MSYTKQTWADGPQGGTPRSAARLTHQENGIKEASDRLDVLEDLNLTSLTVDGVPVASFDIDTTPVTAADIGAATPSRALALSLILGA